MQTQHIFVLPVRVVILVMGMIQSAQADHPLTSFGGADAGPFTTISAATASEGSSAVSLQLDFNEFDAFSDEKLEALGDAHSTDSVLKTALSIVYGVSNRLTVGAQLTRVQRRNFREVHGEDGHHEEEEEEEHEEGDQEEHHEVENIGDLNGLGDTTIFGQYRITEDNASVATSLLFGLKIPTGETHLRTPDGERVEASHQPGSGSWDGLVGLAHSRSFGVFSFDTNILITLTTEGSQSTQLGNVVSYNAALSRPIFEPSNQHGHNHGEHAHWSASVELNGEWRGKDDVSGSNDDNTGGNVVFLSPGLRLITEAGLSVGVSVGLPVVINLDGHQVEPEWRGLLSFSMPL